MRRRKRSGERGNPLRIPLSDLKKGVVKQFIKMEKEDEMMQFIFQETKL
jgi:hypothetical protein